MDDWKSDHAQIVDVTYEYIKNQRKKYILESTNRNVPYNMEAGAGARQGRVTSELTFSVSRNLNVLETCMSRT